MKPLNVTHLSFVLSIVTFLSIIGCTSNEGIDPIVPLGIGAITPDNNATAVPRNASIEISFTEDMDPATINCNTIIVLDGTTFVPTTVTYSDTKAVITPMNDLMALTAYTVTVYTDATTLAGEPLPGNIITSFTTGGSVAVHKRVPLGYASDYVIVGRTAITNRSISSIIGDVALCPATTSNITGFTLTNAVGYGISTQVNGKIYAPDMAPPTSTILTSTVDNMVTAYSNAEDRISPDFLELNAGSIGGRKLTPGLYKWTSDVMIPSSIVLSGDPNDVWIFQIDENLTTGATSNITLDGGALTENIFWQVSGQVTVGTASHFEGIILSKTAITLLKGASLNGQMLSQTSVHLDNNSIVKQ